MRRITLFIFIAVAMLFSCQNKSKQSECFTDMPQFEQRFPQKTLVVRHPYTKENCDSVITYSSMEEAEWKLVHYFFPDGVAISNMIADYYNFDYDLFKEVVMSDSSSMNYPFDSIRHYADFQILDSKDSMIRFYVWEPQHDGRWSDAYTLVQYRRAGKIHFQASFYHDWTGAYPFSLRTLHVKGDNYYLTADEFPYGGECFVGYSVYLLTDSGLVEVAGHEGDTKESGREHAVSYEFYPGDWYSRTSGMGFEWLDYFDEKTNVLYVPEEDVYLNDRYLCYLWDGKQMRQIGDKSVANPFLHLSLKDYESLEFLKLSKRNLIRVDKIKDGIYRYAAWAADKKMDSEPELVITNGTRDEKTKQFIFKNKEYEYRVSEYNLYVLKDGKQIAKYDFED